MLSQLMNKSITVFEAWVEIHQEELMADWKLATSGQPVFQIEPLK
jgi:hypothetical protein